MTVARLIRELQKLHPRATVFVDCGHCVDCGHIGGKVQYVGGVITGPEVVAPKSDAYLWTSKERPGVRVYRRRRRNGGQAAGQAVRTAPGPPV